MSYDHVPTTATSPSHSPTLQTRKSVESVNSDTELRGLEMTDGPSGAETFAPLPSRHRRSSTVGSMVFPLMTLSLSEADEGGRPTTERTVGLAGGIALVVGSQIGSGIFSAPGVVIADVKSVGAALTVWLISGVLAWTGASSFAELGSMIPLNGGAQAYLAYSYGPLVSYLYTWTAISLLKPCSAAIISLVFGEYLCRIMFHATQADALPNEIPEWAIKITAFVAITLVTVINIASNRLGSRANVLFTVLKVGALVAVLVLGLIQIARGKTSSSLTEPMFSGTSSNPSSFALALYSGLWQVPPDNDSIQKSHMAFDGWDQSNLIAGELKSAEKTLPRVIHISMAVVLTLYLAANVAYFAVLEKATVGLSNTVAMDFGRDLFGSIGAVVFSIVVAISSFGALSAGGFASARVVYVAGQEGYLPKMFGQLHSSRKTPVNALLLNMALASVFIAVGGGFRTLVNVLGVAAWGFYFLTVVGLLILRVTEPRLERPYKTWIITPVAFSAVALFLLLMPVFAAPMEALSAVGFVAVGVPLYYATRKHHVASVMRSSSRRNSDLDESFFARIQAFFAGIVGRLTGKPVSSRHTRLDDHEETVEMLEASDR
ncbi:L-methionine transporter [Clavulina sp. PMI_390]|nr:L-methionine transporter [Clavulina sp. PMI_390]